MNKRERENESIVHMSTCAQEPLGYFHGTAHTPAEYEKKLFLFIKYYHLFQTKFFFFFGFQSNLFASDLQHMSLILTQHRYYAHLTFD